MIDLKVFISFPNVTDERTKASKVNVKKYSQSKDYFEEDAIMAGWMMIQFLLFSFQRKRFLEKVKSKGSNVSGKFDLIENKFFPIQVRFNPRKKRNYS